MCPRWSYKCVLACRASGAYCLCSSDSTVSQHFYANVLQCQQEGLWQNILSNDGGWFLHHNKPAVHLVLCRNFWLETTRLQYMQHFTPLIPQSQSTWFPPQNWRDVDVIMSKQMWQVILRELRTWDFHRWVQKWQNGYSQYIHLQEINFEGKNTDKLLSRYKKKEKWPGNILTAHFVTMNVFRYAQ